MTLEQQNKAAAEIIAAVASAIKELGSVPSGHLYARLMGHMSFSSYNNIIRYLERIKLISVQSHLITWIGK